MEQAGLPEFWADLPVAVCGKRKIFRGVYFSTENL